MGSLQVRAWTARASDIADVQLRFTDFADVEVAYRLSSEHSVKKERDFRTQLDSSSKAWPWLERHPKTQSNKLVFQAKLQLQQALTWVLYICWVSRCVKKVSMCVTMLGEGVSRKRRNVSQ